MKFIGYSEEKSQWHCEWTRVDIFEMNLDQGFSEVAEEFGKEKEKLSVIPLGL